MLSMIHIFPVLKMKVDALAAREQLLVCTTDQEGNLLITGLEKYLKREQRRRRRGRGERRRQEELPGKDSS
jgi:hypothetical protein